MKERLVIAIVLLSMVLHCSSRIGFLSYLYQQRHEFALAVGLIAEAPIALCGSDYDFNPGLLITEDNDLASIPLTVHTNEINLFVDNNPTLSANHNTILLRQFDCPPYIEIVPNSPPDGVFQPPRV